SLVLGGQSPQAAAAACGASRATGYRLWSRYQQGGWAALADRPPVPKRQPRRLSSELEQRILAAREYAKAGPLIVAGQLGLPASTVWKVLRRYGVSRLQRPARGPIVRYERARPGELVHVDIKKLGRFWTLGKRALGPEAGSRNRHAGWQYLHLAIDDHSRLAYAELLPGERPADSDRTAHSAADRRSAASHRSVGPTSSPRVRPSPARSARRPARRGGLRGSASPSPSTPRDRPSHPRARSRGGAPGSACRAAPC